MKLRRSASVAFTRRFLRLGSWFGLRLRAVGWSFGRLGVVGWSFGRLGVVGSSFGRLGVVGSSFGRLGVVGSSFGLRLGVVGSLFGLLLGAPTSTRAQAHEIQVERSTVPGAQADAQANGPTAPAGTDALAARLRARHVRDLPRAETLRAPLDLARLRWLAEHDRWLVVRTRALLLLGTDPAPDTRALILRVLDSTQPAIVRAAALRATEAWSLDRGLRDRLQRLAGEADPRLSEPARCRLTTPEGPPSAD